eukprot:GHVP01069554.1.p2 GENE.GHVP01069554.1~~GHVP01069554.1.p2  ORF type:complete len:535 (-),score=91.28 GHVP01069554.1:130-1734(-)
MKILSILVGLVFGTEINEDLSRFPFLREARSSPQSQAIHRQKAHTSFQQYPTQPPLIPSRIRLSEIGFGSGRILKEEDCPVAFDIVLLQDLTDLTEDIIDENAMQIKTFANSLFSKYPGSRVALSGFRDKPIPPLGWENDFCYRNFMKLSNNAGDLHKEYASLKSWIDGGGDWAGNHLEAIYHTTKSPLIGWSRDSYLLDGITKIVRVIVLMTNSIYHVAGDATKADGNIQPNNYDEVLDCEGEDYPFVWQVGNSLLEYEVEIAFLPGSDIKDDKHSLTAIYEELNLNMFNTTLKGTNVDLNNSLGLSVALERVIKDLKEKECPLCEADATREEMIIQDFVFSNSAISAEYMKYLDARLFGCETCKVSLFSHTDKPIEPFGNEASLDYCFHQHSGWLNVSDFLEAYKFIELQEGKRISLRQNHLDAVIQGVNALEWDSPHPCRCVTILTDSGPHLAGDFKGGSVYVPGEPNCIGTDYPSLIQFGQELKKKGISCVDVVASPLGEQMWLEVKEFFDKDLSTNIKLSISILLLKSF